MNHEILKYNNDLKLWDPQDEYSWYNSKIKNKIVCLDKEY